jgi:beta-galactosidase
MLRSCALLLIACAALAALEVAPPPAGEPTWGSEPVEEGGGVRATICLNGLWRFQPERASGTGGPAGTWGWIRVPGAWAVRGARLPGIAVPGGGAAWDGLGGDPAGKEWNGVGRGWYEREIAVPTDWAGRRIRLDLERVSTDAAVWIDGVQAGSVSWPGGSVDLSRQLHPGATSVLRLLVTAAGDGAEVTEHTGAAADQVFSRRSVLATRGVIGDALLRSDPASGRVEEMAIRTSTRRGRIDLDLVLAGASGPVAVRARMLDPAGRAEREFTATATPGADGACSVGWDWADARHWDLGRPELYVLDLAVRGPGIDDALRERFGFREVWVEGRRLFLNGSEFHPRAGVVQNGFDRRLCTSEGIDGVIDGLRAAGFDCMEMWPWDMSERGSPSAHGLWYERAATRGWGVFASLISLGGVAKDWPAGQAAWQAAVAAQIRRWRNNPAILGWVHSPNLFGPNTDLDPRVLGDRDALTAACDAGRIAPGLAAQAIIHALDPTRPATAHQGGPVGDIQAVNFYPCLQQPQEVEEWLSRYLVQGDMPFWPVEFGPFYLDYRRGRLAGGWGRPNGTIFTGLLATEHLAAAYGDEAYRQETAELRALNPQHFQGGERYTDIYKTWLTPLAEVHQAMQLERVVRSWRALGAPLLPIPWELELGWDRRLAADGSPADAPVPSTPFQPGLRGAWLRELPAGERFWLQPRGSTRGARGDAIARVYAPTLAFIAGAERDGDPTALTAKDHAFAAGAGLAKQAALINDSRAEQAWSLRWTVRVGGAEVASGSDAGSLATGAVRRVAIACRLPAVTSATAGEVAIAARIGASEHADRFPFRVFPIQAPLGLAVAAIDPAGDTSALLRRLGCELAAPAPERLLVVGRNALASGAVTIAELRRQAEAGARILVMAQDPAWIAKAIGWRVGHQVVRRVFAVDPGHPLLEGLEGDDLADWAGAGSLIAAQPEVAAPARGYPRYGWHWGNRGSVCSAMIEKPQRSAWRPLLEGDFDLAYTPLMELELGAGRMVWCSLDLEARGAEDAAADRLAANLLRYAAAAPPVRAGRCVLSGDGRALAAVGVTAAAQGGLLVLGAGGDGARAEAHLAAGGTVLCLAPEVLGIAVAERADASGSPQPPPWPWCRGLSRSDLRLRCPAPQRVVVPAEGLEVAADGLLAQRRVGAGLLAICLLDPATLPADERTYLRLSRWRRTRALAQVCANLGAGFATDTLAEPGWYRPDWEADQAQGDDPHRYYRW